jgi:hypothetical protein
MKNSNKAVNLASRTQTETATPNRQANLCGLEVGSWTLEVIGERASARELNGPGDLVEDLLIGVELLVR